MYPIRGQGIIADTAFPRGSDRESLRLYFKGFLSLNLFCVCWLIPTRRHCAPCVLLTENLKGFTMTIQNATVTTEQTQAVDAVPVMPKDIPIKQIEAAILTIATTTKDLGKFIHNTAIQCLMHAEKHSDNFIPLTNLVKAMDKSQRTNALRKWIEAFAPCVWNPDTNQFIKDATNTTGYKIYDAARKPYFEKFAEVAVEVDLSPEALAERLFNVAKKVLQARDKGKQIAPDALAMAQQVMTMTEGKMTPKTKAKAATPALSPANVAILGAAQATVQATNGESVAA